MAYKKPPGDDKKQKIELEEQLVRSRRAGEVEVEMIKALYANDPSLLALRNRRIVSLGMEGIAVIYDDPEKIEGCAVIKDGNISRSACVTLANGKCYEGEREVEMKGWIHVVLSVFATSFPEWSIACEITPL